MRILLASLFALCLSQAAAQSCYSMSAAQKAHALQTHLYEGAPSTGALMVRRAYITEYNETYRVPRWVAWHASSDYRPTPRRSAGTWGSFYRDTDVPNPVVTRDYVGLYDGPDNFARGHLAPYFISGGDRNANGEIATLADGETRNDPYDACTVREINYMTNITPQYHRRFNGSPGGEDAIPGLWYQLETIVRERIDRGEEYHLIAGTLFAEHDVQLVGRDNDIGVPDEFFKIVVTNIGPVGFLFSHRRTINADACALDSALEACIIPIATIEAATGLDFFAQLPDGIEAEFEAIDGQTVWQDLIAR